MHIFSTTMYSNRRKNKINIYKNDIENYISVEYKLDNKNNIYKL